MTELGMDVPKNLRHEHDGIAEGHHAFLDGPRVKVVSDTYPDLYYLVSALGAVSGPIVFACQTHRRRTNEPCDETHRRSVSPTPGVVPCKHAAIAARRLEREGLAVYEDGLWLVSPAVEYAVAADGEIDDPFAGFPKF